MLIVIKKSSQGKGITSKLLTLILKFCDDEQVICYLKTNKNSNISLNNYFDFKFKKIQSSDVYYDIVRKSKKNYTEVEIWQKLDLIQRCNLLNTRF